MGVKVKHWGPFRVSYGKTKWNEKTVALGAGKAYDFFRQEWFYFVALNFYAAFINFGIRKGKRHEAD